MPLRRPLPLRRLALVLALAAVALTLPAVAARAQSSDCPAYTPGEIVFPIGPSSVAGRAHTTGLLVSNRGTSDVGVYIFYVSDSGSCSLRTVRAENVPAMGTSKPILDNRDRETGDAGSIRIIPDHTGSNLEATINYTDPARAHFASTEGIKRAATTLNLPMLKSDTDKRGNGPGDDPGDGTSSRFRVQNVSAARTTAVIRYYYTDAAGAKRVLVENQDIPAYASALLEQRDKRDPATGARMPEVYSATIQAPAPLAATVLTSGPEGLSSYNAIPLSADPAEVRARRSGAAPLVMAYNWPDVNTPAFTGIQVQNTGSTVTDIDIHFSKNIAKREDQPTGPQPCDPNGPGNAPVSKHFDDVAPGQSVTLIQHKGDPGNPDDVRAGFDVDGRFDRGGVPCRYIGSATAWAEDGGQVAVLVQQVGYKMASLYTGLDGRADATSIPLLNVDTREPGNPAIYTGLNLQAFNTDNATINKVKVKFGPNASNADGNGPNCAVPDEEIEVFTTAAGAANLLLGLPPKDRNGNPDPSSPLNDFVGCVYVGSATITAERDTQGVMKRTAVVVNQVARWYNEENLGTWSIG